MSLALEALARVRNIRVQFFGVSERENKIERKPLTAIQLQTQLYELTQEKKDWWFVAKLSTGMTLGSLGVGTFLTLGHSSSDIAYALGIFAVVYGVSGLGSLYMTRRRENAIQSLNQELIQNNSLVLATSPDSAA